MKRILLFLALSLAAYVSFSQSPIYGRLRVISGTYDNYFQNGTDTFKLGWRTDRFQLKYNTNKRFMDFVKADSSVKIYNKLILESPNDTMLSVRGILRSSSDANINDITIGKGYGNKAKNVALGYRVLTSVSTGDENTAIGYSVLSLNTSGNINTGVGSEALRYNSTGSQNTTVGRASMNKNTTGSNNVVMGVNALNLNTTGNSNTALGHFSLWKNNGNYNTAIGGGAMQNMTTGAENTAVGTNTGLGLNGYAIGLTLIGINAGRSLTVSPSYNTFIGYNAGYNALQKNNATNSMGLGNGAYTTADNQYVYGNTSVTEHNFRSGKVIMQNSIDTTLSVRGNAKVDTLFYSAISPGIPAWFSNGNAGTDPSVNFIGTTDTARLIFKINGVYAGTIDSTLNFANRGGATHFGFRAGQKDTIWGNSFFGYFAGSENTGGIMNVAVGAYALSTNVIGEYNTAVGQNAMRYTTGGWNTAIGQSSLQSNIDGEFNTFVGEDSYQKGSTGSYNSGLGAATLNNCYGNNNTTIGSHSGNKLTSGSYNLFLGNYAGYYGNWNYKGFIDVIDRGDSASQLTSSPIVIDFNVDSSLQNVTFNADIYVNDTAFMEHLTVTDSITFTDLILDQYGLAPDADSVLVADDGIINLRAGAYGRLEVYVFNSGVYAEYAQLIINADGSIALMSENSANVTNTGGTDGNLNIYDGGTYAIIENKLGGSRTIKYWFTH